MQDKIKINLETGFKVDVVHPSEMSIDVIETPMDKPLFKPKWTGKVIKDEEGNQIMSKGEWVEGATQEEIDELTKIKPKEPTIEERLEEIEKLLSFYKGLVIDE